MFLLNTHKQNHSQVSQMEGYYRGISWYNIYHEFRTLQSYTVEGFKTCFYTVILWEVRVVQYLHINFDYWQPEYKMPKSITVFTVTWNHIPTLSNVPR